MSTPTLRAPSYGLKEHAQHNITLEDLRDAIGEMLRPQIATTGLNVNCYEEGGNWKKLLTRKEECGREEEAEIHYPHHRKLKAQQMSEPSLTATPLSPLVSSRTPIHSLNQTPSSVFDGNMTYSVSQSCISYSPKGPSQNNSTASTSSESSCSIPSSPSSDAGSTSYSIGSSSSDRQIYGSLKPKLSSPAPKSPRNFHLSSLLSLRTTPGTKKSWRQKR